ncbi:hypothetical protein AY599_25615 [Leptolyngbya valderiana BDU 20041]|nr:hypothetical protein AY599_25615 [Leptolyngbya valderiana BDU 20041]
MPTRPPEFDQSDRSAHPWSIAEPGSWTELAESTAFVCRAGGLALHPLTLALAAVAALAVSWALPLGVTDLLPWLGDAGVGAVVWAWVRLLWIVLVACVCGTIAARTIAARPTRAEVWGALPTMLASAGLCVSTYVAALLGVMLGAWLGSALGGWIGGGFGATLGALVVLVCLLAVVLATLMLLLAIPAIATNDADAPDAIQRAAAHLIARPGLSLALLVLSLFAAGIATLAGIFLVGLATAAATAGFDPAPRLVWLPSTVGVFVALAVLWSALTQTVLTLREVVDREDRASCWDAAPQAEAIHRAIEARATIRREEAGNEDRSA